MALINVLWRHCWRYCWRHCFPRNHVSGDGSNYSIVLVYQLLYPYLLTSNSRLWYYLSVLLLLLFFLSFFVVFHKLFIIQPIGFCSSLTCSKPLIQEQLNRSLQSTEFNPTVKASAFSKIGESFTLQEWEWKISTFSEISEFLQLPKEDNKSNLEFQGGVMSPLYGVHGWSLQKLELCSSLTSSKRTLETGKTST